VTDDHRGYFAGAVDRCGEPSKRILKSNINRAVDVPISGAIWGPEPSW
jgi:hypothetical protein